MKTFSKEDMQKDAYRLMAAHSEKKIFATQDGNMFFKELDAKNHNGELKRLTGNEDLVIIPFEATGEEGKDIAVESEETIAAKQVHAAVKKELTDAKAAKIAATKKNSGDDVKQAALDALK